MKDLKCHISNMTFHMWHLTCPMSSFVCHIPDKKKIPLSYFTCHISHVTFHMSHVTFPLSHFTCNISHFMCHILHFTCHISQFICHISQKKCNVPVLVFLMLYITQSMFNNIIHIYTILQFTGQISHVPIRIAHDIHQISFVTCHIWGMFVSQGLGRFVPHDIHVSEKVSFLGPK